MEIYWTYCPNCKDKTYNVDWCWLCGYTTRPQLESNENENNY